MGPGPVRLGVLAVRLLIYALFVLAGTCFCLALVVLAGGAAIRLGLGGTGGFRLAARLLLAGGGALALGFLVHGLLARFLSRGRASDGLAP